MSGVALDPESGLTDQRVIFCRAYAVAMSVSDAERAAGYVEGYGSDLLRDERIQAYVRGLMNATAKRAKVDAVRVLSRAWELGNSDISELDGITSLAELRSAPARVRRAVKKIKQREFLDKEGNTLKVETEIEMHPKMPALQLLALATGAVTQGQLNGSEAFEGFTVLVPERPALPKPEGA